MRLPLNWLVKHIKLNCDISRVMDILPELGMEIKQIVNLGEDLRDLVMAQIDSVKPHPNADSLLICQLRDAHNNSHLVVCGDCSVQVGQKVIYAPPNAHIPQWNGRVTSKGIRGVKSHGMICSLQELSLPCAPGDLDKIHVFSEEVDLTMGVAEALDIDLPILELDITPNRSDCMNILGITRELQARGLGTMVPTPEHVLYDRVSQQVEVTIDSASCFIYMGRIITHCHNDRKTPSWMQNLLRGAHVPLSTPIMDIVNYVSYVLGFPLQVFDLDKLSERSIGIENVIKPETISNVSDGRVNVGDGSYIGTVRQIPANAFVMRNGRTIINVNGSFYDVNFMCDHSTDKIYLGAGFFNGDHMASTNRLLGLHNNDSIRLERGVDCRLIKQALDMATALIVQIIDGDIGKISITGDLLNFNVPISLHVPSVSETLGISIPSALIGKYLRNLGFQINKISREIWQVHPPSWRDDCNSDVDLIEEVARLHGYELLDQVDHVTLKNEFHELTDVQNLISKIAQVMISRRLHEVITVPFVSREESMVFSMHPMHGEQYNVDDLVIANAGNTDQNTLRSSLLPGLLRCLNNNVNRGCEDLNIYETGMIFYGTDPHKQIMGTAVVRYGPQYKKYWGTPSRGQDIFDVRADLDAILRTINVDPGQVKIETIEAKHRVSAVYVPDYSGQYVIQDQVVGYFGLLNPQCYDYAHLRDQEIWIAELLLDRILAIPRQDRHHIPQSPYPAVRRDFCFVMEQNVRVQDLVNTIKSIPLDVAIEVHTFDYYTPTEGKTRDQRSVTFGVYMVPTTQTLTDDMIKKICDDITRAITNQPGVKLR